MGDSRRAIAVFGVASLAAVAGGCAAMAQSGVAPSSWLRSVVAWAVGGAFAALIARYADPRRASVVAVILATFALLATLFDAGVDGVHRWLDLGPLHVNAAALVLPALIVALASVRIQTWARMVVTLITAAVLLAQPDASQLTAFAAAASILFTRSGAASGWKAFALLVALVVVIAGWMRPDPVQPVAEVEQIFAMCVAVSPILALIAGLALTAATAAPLMLSSATTRDAGFALSAYFVAVSIAPFCGWFPVPLVGLGMSFPLGWWLGMGLLLAVAARLPFEGQ
jgi:hypothetical protein